MCRGVLDVFIDTLRKDTSMKEKKKSKRGLRQRISEALDLPAGAVYALPGIYLSGDREAVIDGKCTLLAFSHEEIVLHLFSLSRAIAVKGEELTLQNIASGGVKISGKIEALRFQPKEARS